MAIASEVNPSQQGADARRLLAAFERGLPPPPRLAARCLVGLDTLFQEWKRDLETYVAGGGSLLRVVVAAPGSGKTHLGEALKATAAERGFLVCKIDAQSQHTSEDDLLLYRGFCLGLTVPDQYLGSLDVGQGLRSVLDQVAERMDGSAVRELLRPVKLPVPALKDTLAALVDASRSDMFRGDSGWGALLAVASGEKVRGLTSLSALRARYPSPFGHLKKLPGKRDARLWLESLLLALRPLGFPGVLLVLDEHDDARKKSLDESIVQLRQQLDRLAEGHLPGVFVLYLVLDDFPDRVKASHPALDQRMSPLIKGNLPSRLMAELSSLRDLEGAGFLEAIAERLHTLIMGAPMPGNLCVETTVLAKKHAAKLGGADTRAFVQSIRSASRCLIDLRRGYEQCDS